jgi:chaperonin GroES
MQPTGDRVLMEMDQEEEKSLGGIIIPGCAIVKQWIGKVIAKGTGKHCKDLEVGKRYVVEKMFEQKDGSGRDGIDMEKNQMLVAADLLVAEVEG